VRSARARSADARLIVLCASGRLAAIAAVFARAAWGLPLVGLLAEEVVKDDPGQAAVLDRLLDRLLIAALRVRPERSRERTGGLSRSRGSASGPPALHGKQHGSVHAPIGV
jgi:Cupin